MENVMGLDIGTGFVKIATPTRKLKFPSIIAEGKHIELESDNKRSVYVGYEAAKYEAIKSITLRTPVYRGAPTEMEDYVSLVRHAADMVVGRPKGILPSNWYGGLVIVAGVPFSAKGQSDSIKEVVQKTLNPKFFGIIYQARATLIHENLEDGIVCHIGHGTTEIMAVVGGKIAHATTIKRGVGDIMMSVGDSKTDYISDSYFSKNSQELAEQRSLLASYIQDVLEKVVIDFEGLQVVCAGGGSLIPKLVSELKNSTITNIRTASDPVYSNALGMLAKAQRYNGSYK